MVPRKWYEMKLTRPYAINHIVIFYTTPLYRITSGASGRWSLTVFGHDQQTNNATATRLNENFDYCGWGSDPQVRHGITYDTINQEVRLHNGTSNVTQYMMNIKLVNDIRDYEYYTFKMETSNTENIIISNMYFDYRSKYESDYTMTSAAIMVPSMSCYDGTFTHGATPVRVKLFPCVPIPIRAKNLRISIDTNLGTNTITGFRTTSASPVYTELTTEASIAAISGTISRVSVLSNFQIGGNSQHHLTIQDRISAAPMVFPLCVTGSTKPEDLDKIKQWFLNSYPTSLTYDSNVEGASAKDVLRQSDLPMYGAYGNDSEVKPDRHASGFGGTQANRARDMMGFIDYQTDEYNFVRLISFCTAVHFNYELYHPGRLLAPFSYTNRATVPGLPQLSYGTILLPNGILYYTNRFGRTIHQNSGEPGHYDYLSGTSTYFGNATKHIGQKSYWGCPVKGAMIVFYAQAVPTPVNGVNWNRAPQTTHKLQCNRIRLFCHSDSPERGRIYGTDSLTSTWHSSASEIHRWDAGGTGYGKWAYAEDGVDSSDTNNTTSDYQNGSNASRKANALLYYNFIVMVVEELPSGKTAFDLACNATNNPSFLKFKYQKSSFKSISH